MKRAVLLLTVVGCSPQVQLAPERFGCDEVTTSRPPDGDLTYTQTRSYDEEGRVISLFTDVPGQYAYEESYTYDADGCQLAFSWRQDLESDGYYANAYQTECDANGNPVTQSSVYTSTVGRGFEWATDSAWVRTYRSDGLTESAVRTDTTRQGSYDTLITYEYDALGREIRVFGESDFDIQLRTQVWFDELDSEDLLASVEVRDGLGLLTRGTYNTFDNRGRATVVRTLDADRVETVVETVFEKKGYVPVSSETRVDGELLQTTAVTTDGADPYLSIAYTIDGGEEAPDGQPDELVETVWTCP